MLHSWLLDADSRFSLLENTFCLCSKHFLSSGSVTGTHCSKSWSTALNKQESPVLVEPKKVYCMLESDYCWEYKSEKGAVTCQGWPVSAGGGSSRKRILCRDLKWVMELAISGRAASEDGRASGLGGRWGLDSWLKGTGQRPRCLGLCEWGSTVRDEIRGNVGLTWALGL